MNPFASVAVFLVVCLCSLATGFSSYRNIESMLVADLNNALEQTLKAKSTLTCETDTIKACRILADYGGDALAVNVIDDFFRSNIKDHSIRSKAYTVCSLNGNTPHRGFYLQSDSAYVYVNGRKIMVQGYAACNPLEILAMSDQRMSLSFFAIAMAWMSISLFYVRKHNLSLHVSEECNENLANSLELDSQRSCLHTGNGSLVCLTPMQFRLMQMFMDSVDNQLSKSEICSSLWPKKPDASETLYTLMRRLRLVLKENSPVRIESTRNGYYKLVCDE